MTSFWWRHQITSAKLRHQNDVTKIFIFKPPSLAKSWLRPWQCPGRTHQQHTLQSVKTRFYAEILTKICRKLLYFLEKNGKIAPALGAPPPNPRWPPAAGGGGPPPPPWFSPPPFPVK